MSVTAILRISTVIVLTIAVGIAGGLVYFGAPVWLAVLVGIALPLAVHGVPLAIEFATGALIDRRPGARLHPLTLTRVWLRETWRSFMVFNVDQPWRAGFAEPTVVRHSLRPAVLFIHGYMCNRATWRPWLLDRGLAQRWNCATVNLEPVYGTIDSYPERIHAAVERLRSAAGVERITLVCHSMGGLAARAYLRAHGAAAVARVITIDSPHHGTVFARLGRGRNTRQMEIACEFVRTLAASEEPVEFICFASQHDNMIVPRESQVLACAEAVWFERIGHLAMTTDDSVLARLIEIVERPAVAPLPRQQAQPLGAGAANAAVAAPAR